VAANVVFSRLGKANNHLSNPAKGFKGPLRGGEKEERERIGGIRKGSKEGKRQKRWEKILKIPLPVYGFASEVITPLSVMVYKSVKTVND